MSGDFYTGEKGDGSDNRLEGLDEAKKDVKRMEGIGYVDSAIVKKTENESFKEQLSSEAALFDAALVNLEKILSFEPKEKGGSILMEPDVWADASSGQIHEAIEKILNEGDKICSKFDEFYVVAKNALEKLKLIKIDSEKDIQKINDLLDKAVSSIIAIRDEWSRIPALLNQARSLWQDYQKIKLKECGFSSFDEVSDKRRRIHGELIKKRGGFFVWLNKGKKGEIKRLEEEEEKLSGLRQLDFQEIKISQPNYQQERNLEDLTIDLNLTVIGRIQQRYEDILAEFSESGKDQELILKEESITQLINDFVEKSVGLKIEKEKEILEELSKSHSEYKKDADDFSGENVVKALAMAKEAFSYDYKLSFDYTAPESDRVKVRQIEEEIGKLPYSLKVIVKSEWTGFRGPLKREFQAINQIMTRFPWEIKRKIAVDQYGNILEKLSYLASRARKFYPVNSLIASFNEKQRQIKKTAWQEEANNFIDSFNPLYWEIFVSNQAMREKFSPEHFSQARIYLSQIVTERLFDTKEHTDESVDLGYKLLNFKNASSAPVIVLNAYRESGHSGDFPFIPRAGISAESPLYQFVASLNEDDLDHLKEKNIPGLFRAIELIKGNADNFTKERIENPQIARFQDELKDNAEFLNLVAKDWFKKVQRIKIVQNKKEDLYFDDESGDFEISEKKFKEWLPSASLPKKAVGQNSQVFEAIKIAYASEELSKARIAPYEEDSRHLEGKMGYWEGDLGGNLFFKMPRERLCYFLAKLNFDLEIFDKKKIIANPAYNEIQKCLIQMAVYYFQEGNDRMKCYISGVLENLNVELGPSAYEMMLNALNEANPVHDDKLRGAIFSCFSRRFKRGDNQAAFAFLRAYPGLNVNLRDHFKGESLQVFSAFISAKDAPEEEFKILADLFEIPPERLMATIDFIKSIVAASYYFYDCQSMEQFDNFVELANTPGMLDFIRHIFQLGYSFDIDHYVTLLKIFPKREEVFIKIQEIRDIVGDFRYNFLAPSRSDSSSGNGRVEYISDPYEIIISQIGAEKIFEILAKPEIKQDILDNFTNGLLHFLRQSDPILSNAAMVKSLPVTEDVYGKFYRGLKDLSENLRDPEGALIKYNDVFANTHFLRFTARHPELFNEAVALPQNFSYLFDVLFAPDGPLHANKGAIIKDIFDSDYITRRAKEVESVFKQKLPYWRQLYLFTKTRLSVHLSSAISQYPISEISGVPLAEIISRHQAIRQKDAEKLTRLEKICPRPETRQKLISGEIKELPFVEISSAYKSLVFRDYLKRTIEISRSDGAKKEADFRNRQEAAEKLVLKAGIFLHASAIDNLESVLLNGNLPKEALGDSADVDSYPFHVDFSCLTESFVKEKENKDILLGSLSAMVYGEGGKLGADGKVFYIYNREMTNWERGKDYGPKPEHALLLGGIPATEISALVVRNPEKTLAISKQAILENGFYIPIYDMDGNLLFTEGEYDLCYEDQNLGVPVEVWDYSLKTGEKRGSNPGGEYTVPTKDGSVQYYVKFGERGTKEEIQMWTEVITDEIYRACNIAVPDTAIKKVGNVYGRASRMIKIQSGVVPNFNKGFLADLLTQNYWDMTSQNGAVDEKGETYRIDNGAAWPDYRSTALNTQYDLRKFIQEAKQGILPVSFYKNIPSEDLFSQAKDIVENLTDQRVDIIVNQARLPKHIRQNLEKDIKERVRIIKEEFDL